MFKLTTLPAENGDCLLLEYGTKKKTYNILIDTGTKEAYPHLRKWISKVDEDERIFELFVLTHYDNDHILGALNLFDDKKLKVEYKDIWFNGWPHFSNKALDVLGPQEAEIFSHYIHKNKYSWNAAFSGKAVITDQGKPVSKTFPGGMKLIVLSPNAKDLKRLKKDWETRLDKIGIEPGVGLKDKLPSDLLGSSVPSIEKVNKLANKEYLQEHTPANQSSIAIIAEYQGKRCLLTGDASPDLVLESIKCLSPGNTKYKIDLFKVSHHGSKYNISNDLLKKLDCQNYVISTNGKTHSHPHMEGISKIVVFGGNKKKTINFNYETKFNKYWSSEELMNNFNYQTVFGENGLLSISV